MDPSTASDLPYQIQYRADRLRQDGLHYSYDRMELTIFQELKTLDSEDMLTKNGTVDILTSRTVDNTEVRA